jgi:hypothetical protein
MVILDAIDIYNKVEGRYKMRSKDLTWFNTSQDHLVSGDLGARNNVGLEVAVDVGGVAGVG